MKTCFRELSVAVALAILLVILAIFAPHFYELQPLLSRLTAQVPALILALGVGIVMISRQIDISVGSQFGLCAVLAGTVAAGGSGLPSALAAAVCAGTLMGAINGWLIAWMKLPSIVVTLATMVTWAEALRLFQQGKFVNLPAGIQWFGLSQLGGQIVLISVGCVTVAVGAHCLKTRSLGRYVYAVGSDADAARLSGIHPSWVTFSVFILMGALAGLAAVLNLVQSPQVDPKCGMGLELRAIAAGVVGGIAVNGGRGTLWGVFVGLLLLSTINPALTFLHVEAYWEKAIQGLVILLAVVADGFRSRNKLR